jgi:hypothetical protein
MFKTYATLQLNDLMRLLDEKQQSSD